MAKRKPWCAVVQIGKQVYVAGLPIRETKLLASKAETKLVAIKQVANPPRALLKYSCGQPITKLSVLVFESVRAAKAFTLREFNGENDALNNVEQAVGECDFHGACMTAAMVSID